MHSRVKTPQGPVKTVLLQTQHLYLLPRRWLTTLKWNMGPFCSRTRQADASAKWEMMEAREKGSPPGLRLTQVGGSHVGGLLLQEEDTRDKSASQPGHSDDGETRQTWVKLCWGLHIWKKLQLGATWFPSWPSRVSSAACRSLQDDLS